MFLRELCFFKNTLSRAWRRAGSVRRSKRESSIAKPEFRNRLNKANEKENKKP